MAEPDLGVKPLLTKLREQQPDLGAGTKEVRKALNALKAESEAAKAAAESKAAKAAAERRLPNPPPRPLPMSATRLRPWR